VRIRTAFTVAATLLCVVPAQLVGQLRGSERARTSQISNGTQVTIDYARPLVRGRMPVFGGLIEWGHVWTPGANEATTFEVTSDVTLNGVEVPQGLYSVWLIPSEYEWEVVLDPRADLYHTQPPERRPDQIRFAVTPDAAPFREVLTFDFAMVDPKGMSLEFQWGTTSLPLRIDVPTPPEKTVTAAEAATLVGEYKMSFEGPPPQGVSRGATPPQIDVHVSFDNGRLVGVMKDSPVGAPTQFALIPVASLVFNPGWMMDGDVFEVEVDMYFEFLLEDREATGFEVRGLADRLMMRAQRTR
jgi:hypothetical protein